MKFAWINAHRSEFQIAAMCRVLEVCRAGFYAAVKRPASKRALRREALAEKIAAVYENKRATYGSPRIYRELHEQGEKVCENTIASIMREKEIRVEVKRRFVPCTTDANHDLPVAKNILNREFKAEQPNQKWVSDITYVQTGEGWLYLAAVLDIFSRKVIGWSMNEKMETALVSNALNMALTRRRPEPGVLHHSDRGVQYASSEYQELLKGNGCECSMSRTGNCYDNALMESFWSTLKRELVYRQKYSTRAEARASIFEYIEVFYNRQRRHSALNLQ